MARRTASEPPAPADTAAVAGIGDSIGRIIASWHATRPDLDVDAIAIAARVVRLQARLGARIEAVFSRFGLRSADFALMATLVRLGDEEVSQKRLMAELELSAGTISLRIDRLAGRGLVRREPDPADRRGARIILTEAGRNVFEACAPEHLANTRDLLSGLTAQERNQLGLLLGKLLSTLEDPGPDDRLAIELGLVLDAAPIARERRRAVGLAPRAGLLVRHVDPVGPAATAGIKPGDLLIRADQQPLRTHDDLRLALAHARPPTLELELLRGIEPMTVRLDLRQPAPA